MPPDPGRRHDDHVRPVVAQPALRFGLPGKIERAAVGGQHFVALRRQPPHQGGADHAAVAGDENAPSGQVEWRLFCGRVACHETVPDFS